jgi:tRNA pseudouridine38-40 synthase
MRIRLDIEYDGTNYAGWQRQENALAVQQVIEDKLANLVRHPVVLTGASRTDAGVHALGQAAHFDTEARIPPDKYCYALNALLPPDVRVRASYQVPDNFHARFSAVGKKYRYQIKSAPHAGALTRNTHAHVIYPLNDGLMRREAEALLGTHDFGAFAASGSVVKDTVRTVYSAELARSGDELTLYVTGNGFLYNMVRIVAGTLISVGAGKLESGAFARAIKSGSRLDLGVTAPARGLTLMEVYYDESRLPEDARRADSGK